MRVDILDTVTNELVNAEIEPMKIEDFEVIENSRSFTEFNWYDLKMNVSEIYKLVKDDIILGLIFFFHERVFNRLEINKIEVSKQNRGAGKRYDYIAGCLIAFACIDSLARLSGEVFVMYSSKVKSIYLNNYGFKAFNEWYVKSDKVNSTMLVKKYLER